MKHLTLGMRIDSIRLGMRFSLQSREIIADSIETVTVAQHHDANISIPGCDKNMPGCKYLELVELDVY